MAISKNTPIDFAKIATEMRDIVARWYNATVEVVDPNIRDQVWDLATNTFSGSSQTTIWTGKARVQPLRASSEPNIGVGEGSIRGARIQVPYDATVSLIEKGFQVRITDGGENHVLENLQFVVTSAINSSYGWNTTIECEVDAKSVEDGS